MAARRRSALDSGTAGLSNLRNSGPDAGVGPDMRILTIGGHGKVARHLTPLLAERSHEVTAVIRNPEHTADVEADGATAKVADVQSMSTPELADLVRGFDAVVWSARRRRRRPRAHLRRRPRRRHPLDGRRARGRRRALRHGVVLRCRPDHGVPEDDGFFAYADAKTAADEHLQASGLAWTLVRPSALTDDPSTGRIETSRTGAGKGSVPRADVALVIAEVLARPGTAHAVVEFNTGDTPGRRRAGRRQPLTSAARTAARRSPSAAVTASRIRV